MNRESLVWALVFSVPVGVGITGYTAFVLRGDYINLPAILVGLATTLVIFVVVAYGFTGGSVDEEHVGEGDDENGNAT